jgi:hypothetical protein
VVAILLLLAAAVVAFPPMWSTLGELEEQSKPLLAPESPRGLHSLSLARNRSEAKLILHAWEGRRAVARRVVEIDNTFVPRYARFFALLATFAAAWAYLGGQRFPGPHGKRSRPWLHWLGLLAALALLVSADMGENRGLLRLLDDELDALALTRFFTQAKLTALLLFFLGTLLAIGLGARRTWCYVESARLQARGGGATPPPEVSPVTGGTGGSFQDLVTQEYAQILAARGSSEPANPKVRKETAEEPWVNPCRETLVGLALSGGGIRSATFNLGLLQGLHRLDLLRHVDYLATVSGGGYIGGFWSKWLQQRSAAGLADTETFPDEFKKSTGNPSNETRVFESPEVRHVREFSNFLSPRAGLFDTESWGAAVVFLAALIPALLAALSVLGLSLIAWFMLTFYLACLEPWGGAVFVGLFTACVLFGLEWWWRKQPTGDPADSSRVRMIVTSAAAALAVGCLHRYEREILEWVKLSWKIGVYEPWPNQWMWSPIPAGYDGWWTLLGLTLHDSWVVSPRLYEPSLVWGAVALALLLLRFRGVFARPSMARRVALPTADRTTMRLLALAVLWAVVATFWHLGLNLKGFSGSLLAGAGTGGGLFALLRNWIGGLAQQPKAGIWDRVKPYLPMVLAYITVGLAWAGVSSALSSWGERDWYLWYQAAGAMALVTVTVLLVDPAEFGLHAMYRDRIARAYLGAARAGVKASDNRTTDLRRDDDIALDALPVRPLHLVCCAANDLSGDPIATLSRGARSAVLSRHGVTLGDDWEIRPGVTLASVLTASAAAFNSNMGAVSVQVGPAVAFLMSALNLRLGLWVGNPRRRPTWPRRLPGWLYYKEMFSLTSAESAQIHLSDGGHFDNLALYELVRRHCRYIIVSDCTADPGVALDDFGRTARRIREDFGVEIEVNLDALKPGPDHLARQYAVVGTIDYGWFDKGVVVYVKPSLVGSEPPDILQYKARNGTFPHESTGDQFYDEAQWESYRRLGVQAAREVFKFVEHLGTTPPASAPGEAGVQDAQRVFATARQVWYPTPAGLVERILEMSDRFSLMENEVKRDASAPMLLEVFPELAHVGLRPPATAERTQESELANLGCLLRITQVMEDAVLACALETHWNHPLNLGWVKAFARWATAPTFRAWWSFIRPMYGPDLRTFLEERFPVVRDAAMPSGPVSLLEEVGGEPAGLAMGWWRDRDRLPSLADRRLYQYRVRVPAREGAPGAEVQLALVAVSISEGTAAWTSEEFFVPPSLWGGGLGGRFLQELLQTLRDQGVGKCEVTVKGPDRTSASRAQWEERRGFVDFYRQSGFLIDERRSNNSEAVLSRTLAGTRVRGD